MKLRSIHDIREKHKRVLIRLDLDVPLKGNKVISDHRLVETVSTLKKCLKQSHSLVLIGHRGRPMGKRKHSLSLKPVIDHLSRLLKKKIMMINNLKQKTLTGNTISAFENIRFYPGEEENNVHFSSLLSSFGDIYVNEAFATSHRNHASIVGIPRFLPSYAGERFQKEVAMLSSLFHHPKHPFIVVIGGAKIGSKARAITSLINKADTILLGGGLANHFLLSHHKPIGRSKIEKDHLSFIQKLVSAKIRIPLDVVVARSIHATESEKRAVAGVRGNEFIFDIGPETIEYYGNILFKGKTILWSGPMGVFENKQFAMGTKAICKAITKSRAVTVAGGGDTLTAIDQFNLGSRFSFLSLGGSAMLEFFERGSLPGIECLRK